jgi:hypothetical protein
MDFTMAQAKRAFALGHIHRFMIARHELGYGWCVLVADKDSPHFPLVDARTKMMRVFKSLDAAVSAVVSIGFRAEVLVG